MDRFQSRTCYAGDCVIWTGSVSHGYGHLWANGRVVAAHRFAYESEYGPIPAHLELDHLCRNRICVNPAHLEAVPHQVNIIRAKTVITHCPRGHWYDVTNTRFRATQLGVERVCRKCNQIFKRESRQRARSGMKVSRG